MTGKRSKFQDLFEERNHLPPEPEPELLVEPASVQPGAPPPQQPERSRRPVAKSKNPDYTPVTLYVRKDTYQRVQMRMLAQGRRREVSDLVGELLGQWLAEHPEM